MATGPRTVITGAAGFLGSHLTDALLAKGHEVVGVDNLITGDESNIDSAMEAAARAIEHLPGREHEAPRHPHPQAFWALAPTERDVVDVHALIAVVEAGLDHVGGRGGERREAERQGAELSPQVHLVGEAGRQRGQTARAAR